MSKKRRARKTKQSSGNKKTIQAIHESRTGGQVALSGFSYQMLYSCYLILGEIDSLAKVSLEGIEDIDTISCEDRAKNELHIQIKYSSVKQDASFMKPVLKNMLEVYLVDKNRDFKMVYDFSVAKGNLSKLLEGSIDESSRVYWNGIITEIKNNTKSWDWRDFECDSFIDSITFQKVKRELLEAEIEKYLIEKYCITTGNVNLFANGLKVCCLEKMSNRDFMDKLQLDKLIQHIKDDVEKGTQNPAHNWIQHLVFECDGGEDISYFEGKKATSKDIANGLPVRRKNLENEVKTSIRANKVTVIKASSGQGKTTLALQVAFDLKEEYTVYQISWCNDTRELNSIVMYFESRMKLGEKVLILVDNLDSHLSEWNKLAQIMQERIYQNYKILITTREDDWYHYVGDISNVKSLNIVKILLNEQDAEEIYKKLRKSDNVHSTIGDWKTAWSDVKDKQLLIEYVYLLTHGEMLTNRISEQINQINRSGAGKIKCDLLRIISFADVCGIKLSVKKLISLFEEFTEYDFGEVLKSMENEFLIKVDEREKYIEGMHPVRSQHIVDRLHEFVDVEGTAIRVAKISDKGYLSQLFSNFPRLIKNKEEFYSEIVNSLWSNGIDLLVLMIQGVFSGSVMEYYRQNRAFFDDADEHAGLMIVATEICPFVDFREFNYKLDILSSLKKTVNSENLAYLSNVVDSMPNIVLSETDCHMLCKVIFEQISKCNMDELGGDYESFAFIADWLLNIDEELNLAKMISLDELWSNTTGKSLQTISKLMYLCFCGDKEAFLSFVTGNLPMIFAYLKEATESIEVYATEDMSSVHVNYILPCDMLKKANDESVNRIKIICRTLPIFETYCADAMKPKNKCLSNYKIPDDAHKAMPIKNVAIMFHQEFTVVWSNTIMSNYEFNSVKEWLEFWLSVRKDVVELAKKCDEFMFRLLEGKQAATLGAEIDDLRGNLRRKLGRNNGYPQENRPFLPEKLAEPFGFAESKRYFNDVSIFFQQIAGILKRDNEKTRLPLVNLRSALARLEKMQDSFFGLTEKHNVLEREHELLCIDEKILDVMQMSCMYYLKHSPSKFFKKPLVKVWYDRDCLNRIKQVEGNLNQLQVEYDAIYPKACFYENILSYYPIILSNIDLTDGVEVIGLIQRCTSFIESDFDYLLVAIKDENGEILERGLKITEKCLRDLKSVFDNDDWGDMEKWAPPFPQIIEAKALRCFSQRFDVKISEATEYKGLDIIAELLWRYSKAREILVDETEMCYKNRLLAKYNTEIKAKLSTYETVILKETNDYIHELYNQVLNGVIFDDEEYTDFIIYLAKVVAVANTDVNT
ncbi:MAG: hypothetical protein R3Y06_06560 [Faecalibacterium sp.]